MYVYVSVGVIYVCLIFDLCFVEDIEWFKKIVDGIFKLVKEYGGFWSGEYGDGFVCSFYNKVFFGDRIYFVLKDVNVLRQG